VNNRADDIMTQETLLPTTEADTMLGGEETKNGGIADRSKLFYYHYQLLRMWRMSMIMSRNQPTRMTTGNVATRSNKNCYSSYILSYNVDVCVHF